MTKSELEEDREQRIAHELNLLDELKIKNDQISELANQLELALKAGEKFKKRLDELENERDKEQEPYFGWCDVEGCKKEGCSGGMAWRESGYWIVCPQHSSDFRQGKPQPEMKKESIERESKRLPDGTLKHLPR